MKKLLSTEVAEIAVVRPLTRPAHGHRVVLASKHIMYNPLRVAHGPIIIGCLLGHGLGAFAAGTDGSRFVVDELRREDLVDAAFEADVQRRRGIRREPYSIGPRLSRLPRGFKTR